MCQSKAAANASESEHVKKSMQSNATYKVYYFPFYARAEPLRMMFNKAGIPFEDNRVSGDAWMELKPTTEFGQMPILEVNGTKMYQSAALNNYVAGVCGFAPKDPM